MAAKKFLVDIDLQLNQLIRSLFEISATAPTGTKARFYYNDSNNKPYYFNGSSWVEFGVTIANGMNFKGAYNAVTNTPDLEGGSYDPNYTTATVAILKGDTYVISANGTFYTEAVQIGDMIIAKEDNATTLAQWVVVNKNIPDIVQATEILQGIIELATQAEVNAGIDDQRAITPLKLKNYFTSNPLLLKRVCPVGVIGENVFLITHDLGGDYNISGLIVNVWENGSGEMVDCLIRIESPNEIIIEFNQPCILNNQFTAVIIG